MDAKKIADLVPDADTALSVIHALRSRFNLSATVFTPEDAEAAARTALEDEDEFLEHYVEALTNEIVYSYGYRRMEDTLSERGNIVLSDEASLSPLLTSAHGYAVVAGVDDEEQRRTEVVEIGPFESAQDAHEAGVDALGKTGEEVLAQYDGGTALAPAEALTADDALLGKPLAGFTLVVIRNGQTEGEYAYQPIPTPAE